MLQNWFFLILKCKVIGYELQDTMNYAMKLTELECQTAKRL